MPYSIKKVGNVFQTITTATGKIHGTFNSEEAAKKQLKAMYANTPKSEILKAK